AAQSATCKPYPPNLIRVMPAQGVHRSGRGLHAPAPFLSTRRTHLDRKGHHELRQRAARAPRAALGPHARASVPHRDARRHDPVRHLRPLDAAGLPVRRSGDPVHRRADPEGAARALAHALQRHRDAPEGARAVPRARGRRRRRHDRYPPRLHQPRLHPVPHGDGVPQHVRGGVHRPLRRGEGVPRLVERGEAGHRPGIGVGPVRRELGRRRVRAVRRRSRTRAGRAGGRRRRHRARAHGRAVRDDDALRDRVLGDGRHGRGLAGDRNRTAVAGSTTFICGGCTMSTVVTTQTQPLTDALYAAVKPIWDAQLEHPFVRGIGDGTLEEARFRRWVIQDYSYLKEYSRMFAWAVAKADRLESMGWYAAVLNLTLNTEMALHRKYAERFGISTAELEAAEVWPTTRAYTDFLVRTA